MHIAYLKEIENTIVTLQLVLLQIGHRWLSPPLVNLQIEIFRGRIIRILNQSAIMALAGLTNC